MSDEHAEHLTAAIEQLSDDINGLMQVVEEGSLLKQLVDEVHVLREAIDDLRNEVEWAVRNVLQNGEPRPLPAPITSMPLDPCDPAFASRLIAVSRHDIPADDDEPMFDDDAECFRENNGYPLDDEEEAEHDEEPTERPSPSAPSASNAPPPPPPRAPSEPSPPPSSPAPGTTRSRKQPLATRLFLHRHMADLVRILGHEEHLAEDLQHMMQPLFQQYGSETVRSAIDELVRFEHRDRQAFARLKPEVAQLAVQIIGRPTSPG
jgi:hypothetical protein